MKYILLMISILTVSLFLVSCSNIPAEKKCSADSDCFPSSCCHAADVVNAANKPNCNSVLCTAECEPNTLDCGQGEIRCVSGGCTAIIR